MQNKKTKSLRKKHTKFQDFKNIFNRSINSINTRHETKYNT